MKIIPICLRIYRIKQINFIRAIVSIGKALMDKLLNTYKNPPRLELWPSSSFSLFLQTSLLLLPIATSPKLELTNS